MNVSEALASRISCRAFKPDPVDSKTVRAIIDGARFAPSGGNLQPWRLFAVSGTPLTRLFEDIRAKMADTPRGETPEYNVYPPDLKEPYAARRFKCGEDLYASIGIERDDKPGRIRQFRRNFEMFGAPVGLFVYIDRTMGPPQWSDVGMFLQSIMLLAREHGLHTCAQEAWAQWHTTIDDHLKPPAEWMLFCGIALGYMDEDHPINTLRTERASVDEIVTFLG
ncbi:nitroreductase [Hoeflea sp. WL0058]|uniref:Nitroreductase n=1 Tax=Flavimaribacter sediminis TaxID=2865987 RepID=A0AAE2ZLH9_9HYPH|nr:nitroreductase [Flavimaribacter sediminis]MBW8636538.1 nitroreductase [Flavimaribacter sediminis]